MGSDRGLTVGPVPPSVLLAATTIELKYRSAADVARDRLPQLPRGLLARTQSPVRLGDAVDVVIELERESLRVRARGEVRWVTALASSSLVGLTLEGQTPQDDERLDQLLADPAIGGAVATPALTPAHSFGAAPVLSVAMLQPSTVLRQILSAALQTVTGKLGARWTLKLDACTTPDAFLASMASRRRQLAVVDCDAVRGAEEPLIDAIRSHEGYERLPIVLLSGTRTARLEDPFAVTMQKPLTVKSFLHTTELLLRA
jgi:Tfp pilus assembly protein PilZ